MQTISLKVPDSLLSRLEAEAHLRKVSKSQILRESLEKNLLAQQGDTPTCFDLASDLAGNIKGLPKDLATNPVWMAGFGK